MTAQSNAAASPAVQRALDVEQTMARIPSFSSARILRNGEKVHVIADCSIRSDTTRRERRFTQTYSFIAQSDEIFTSELTPVPDEVKYSTATDDGQYKIVFRVATDKNGKTERVVELYSPQDGLVAEIDVTDKHADFLIGDTWGKPTWNAEQNMLMYVAEQNPPFHKDADKPLEAFEDYPNFGETLYKASRPVLFLLDIGDVAKVTSRQITHQSGLQDVVYAQPCFDPTSKPGTLAVFATGYSLLPSGRRLGQVWCVNRPTGIYRLKLSLDDTDSVVDASRISPSDVSARSAAVRYNRGTPYLYWLSNPLGHEHGSCATIQTAKLPLSAEYSARVLVGPVYDPYDNATIEQDPFPGIYLRDGDTISNKLSDPDEEEAGLLINSQWRSLLKILSISADTGNVRILSDDSEKSSGEAMNSPDTTPQALSLLATDGHKHIVVVRSSSTSYPELLFGTISGSASGDRVGVKWRLLKAWKPTFHSGATQAQDLRATIISIPEFEQTEAIFVTPSLSIPACPAPFILYPHGGPNSAYSNAYSKNVHALVAAGFSVALVNYVGSTGFGQKQIERLTQACGELDVRTTLAVLDFLESKGLVSTAKGKRHVKGGSHGGFLSGHLSARFPERFDSALLSNPVIDVPSNFAVVDIPDWCLEQIGVRYAFDSPPAFVPQEHFDKLRKASPSYHLTKLLGTTAKPCVPPTLMILGEQDLRVAGSQGRAWVQALRTHGEKVKMVVFPECGHRVETAVGQRRSFQAEIEWLVEHARFD